MPVSREETEAARQYLEHDYAAHHLKGEPARAANQNAQQIDEEHERARDIALTGTAQELGKLPPHLRAHQIRSRKQAGITTEHAARIRSEYRAPAAGPKGSRGARGSSGSAGHGSRSRRSAPRSTPRAGAPRSTPAPAPRTVRSSAATAGQTVVSSAGDALDAAGETSLGSLTVQVFAWGMGLSLLYLVLRNAGSLTRITTGVAHATRAVVAVNVDPLNPHGVHTVLTKPVARPSGASGGGGGVLGTAGDVLGTIANPVGSVLGDITGGAHP